tara:strand:- start:60 stop:1289 length:1230 start_codon:yes stop_codon:yes gene_type:complete
MLVGLFISIWVARYLGPAQFGLFSYAVSFVGLFTAISTLGLDTIVVRELVKNQSKRDILLGTAFRLKLFGAFGVIIVLGIAVNFTNNDLSTNLLIFIIASATIFHSFNVVDYYFQSKVLSKYVVYANFISVFLSTILKIILILNKAPLISFAWVILFDSIILSLGLLYFYLYNNLSFRTWKVEKSLAISLLKDSWPLILTGIAVMLQGRIDQVMIKEMINNNEVGQYSVAMKIIEVFDIFSIIIIGSIAPAVTNAKKINEELYYNRLYSIYKLMMIIFIFSASFIVLFGENLILHLYGNEYALAASLFPLFAIRTLFTNYGVARTVFINNNNLFKVSMIFVICSSIINILLNYLLIPIYQSHGALFATIITFLLSIFIFNFFHEETKHNGKLMIKSLLYFYTLKIKDLL